MTQRFEWDSIKVSRNLTKHGVGFEEASTVFDDPLFISAREATRNERRFYEQAE
jgi:uncharacterized DUF497 family protein